MMRRLFLCAVLLTACNKNPAPSATTLTIQNSRTTAGNVFVSFGADSKITAADWSFCPGKGLTCSFPIAGQTSRLMPNPKGAYINATFAFNQPVGCGVTKAEVNINNPKWYDILDVSLVDGYSNNVQIVIKPVAVKDKTAATILGPPHGATGNEKVLGVFPYGCDICVERQNPPCNIKKGKTGCKAGTQYDPKPPCQWQGTTKGGGGSAVTVELL
jgi:hypothetical protein